MNAQLNSVQPVNDQTNAAALIQKEYFDPCFSGEGYLSRIRQVKPKGAKPYFAVAVSFPKGKRKLEDGEKREYLYLDCNVEGESALDLIKKLGWVVDQDQNASIWCSRINIGDLWLDQYPDKNTGLPKPCLKGRLLFLGSIWVNGEVYYQHVSKKQLAQQAVNPSDNNEAQVAGTAVDQQNQPSEPGNSIRYSSLHPFI